MHTIYMSVLTLAYTYADKTTQKQAYKTFTFAQDLTHLLHTYTDRHTVLHTQAHTARARTPACARSSQARALGCPCTGSFRNSRSGGGARGSHQVEGHGF